MTLHFPTRAERPGKLPHADSLAAPDPSAFMNEGAVLKRLFGRVVAEYAEFLFYAWDDERQEVVGVGHAIPAAWDGDPATLPDGGFDAVMDRDSPRNRRRRPSSARWESRSLASIAAAASAAA